MSKYDTWTITCKLCDWQWETCSRIMAKNPKCKHCGSIDCSIEKNEVITIKKQGKIITNIAFHPEIDEDSEIQGELLEKTDFNEKPLVVIRDNDFKFTEDLTNEERRDLLNRIDVLKLKIMRDIVDNINE